MGFSLNDQVYISRDYLSVSQASELSGYNQQYIRRLLRRGFFRTKRIGQIWLIEKSEFISYVDNARQSVDYRFGPK